MKPFTLFCLILLGMLVGVQVPLEGKEKYPKEENLEVVLERARSGDTNTQAIVGMMYLMGERVQASPQEAKKWLELAAANNSAAAQFGLGLIYDQGRGIPEDNLTALDYYTLAAEQGHKEAQTKLGYMYSVGEGVAENDAVAITWYKMAAEQGDDEAQLSLASMYMTGEGTPVDEHEAFRWVKQSAKHGNPQAQYILAAMYATGRGIQKPNPVKAFMWAILAADGLGAHSNAQKLAYELARIMTPYQIEQAQRERIAFTPKRADA